MKTLWQFAIYLLDAGKGWLLPIVLGLIFTAGLVLIGQNSTMAPFLYTVF